MISSLILMCVFYRLAVLLLICLQDLVFCQLCLKVYEIAGKEANETSVLGNIVTVSWLLYCYIMHVCGACCLACHFVLCISKMWRAWYFALCRRMLFSMVRIYITAIYGCKILTFSDIIVCLMLVVCQMIAITTLFPLTRLEAWTKESNRCASSWVGKVEALESVFFSLK